MTGFKGFLHGLFIPSSHGATDSVECALTAVPLWLAILLGRRAATSRYTHDLGCAEENAGLSIIVVVALSAAVAAWQSIHRLFNPSGYRTSGGCLPPA